MPEEHVYLLPGLAPGAANVQANGIGPRYMTLSDLITFLDDPASKGRTEVAKYLRHSGEDANYAGLAERVSAILG